MQSLQDYIANLRPKAIHIVGASGTEGAEISQFLVKHGCLNITLHDFVTPEQFEQSLKNSHYGFDTEVINKKQTFFQQFPGTIHYKDSYLTDIDQADIIFVPQSWYIYKNNQQLHDLQATIPFSSITKLYFDLLPCQIIGITGANGKTTTTNLLYHLAKNCLETPERKVYLTGNDRYHQQLLQQIETITSNDLVITEVSNRQLKLDLGRSPDIGILTNITENHLEEYSGGLEEYTRTKLSLFNKPTGTGKPAINIINADDPISQAHKDKIPNNLEFSVNQIIKEGIYLDQTTAKTADQELSTSNFQLIGNHNKQNLLAALLANLMLGAKPTCLEQSLATFKAPPKRIEFAGTYHNTHYYNDISSTVPVTTLLDLKALKEHKNLPITLILGGIKKGLDYTAFCTEISELVDTIIGINSPFLAELAPLKEKMGSSWHEVDNLTDAITHDRKLNMHEHCTILAPTAIYQAYFKDLDPKYNSFNEIVSA